MTEDKGKGASGTALFPNRLWACRGTGTCESIHTTTWDCSRPMIRHRQLAKKLSRWLEVFKHQYMFMRRPNFWSWVTTICAYNYFVNSTNLCEDVMEFSDDQRVGFFLQFKRYRLIARGQWKPLKLTQEPQITEREWETANGVRSHPFSDDQQSRA